MKIKGQLSLLLISVCIILTTAVSIILYHSVKKDVLANIYAHLESISETKEIRIHDMIDKKHQMARLLTTSPNLIVAFQNYLDNTTEENRKQLKFMLLRFQRYMPQHTKLHITLLNGKVIASTDPSYLGKDFSKHKVFLRARDYNAPFLDGFFYNEDHLLSVSMSSPINFENGIAGILLMDMSAMDFISLTNDYTGLGETGETYLAKLDSGVVILNPLRFDRNAALKRTVPFTDTSYAVNIALNKIEGFVTDAKDYRGNEVIASTRFIQETGWGLVTEIDKKEAYQTLYRMRDTMILICLVAIVITLFLAMLMAKFVAKPIEVLTDSVNKIAEGDLSKRIQVKSFNEIGMLGHSFNTMAARLESNIKELESSNDSLNKFAYVITHDLKSPLNSLMSITEIFRQDYFGKMDIEAQRLINMQFMKLKEMDLLISSVLKSAQKKSKIIEKEKVDLNLLVTKVIDNLNVPPNVTIEIPEHFPFVYHHRIPLMQVFQNLIGNSIKHNDKEKGEIKIGYKEEEAYYTFFIKDNGPGIKLENYDKIFRIFEGAGADPRVESSGIGLSIVKKIIEEYGGQIWLESKVGEGTIFYFTILKQ